MANIETIRERLIAAIVTSDERLRPGLMARLAEVEQEIIDQRTAEKYERLAA